MNDDEHLRRFEDHSYPHESWNHRAHLKVAYLYLHRFDYPEALERLRSGIKAYNAAHGIQDTPTGGYHETMTQAWLQLVHTTLRQFGPAASSDAFFDAQTQLGNQRTLLLFYSRDRLNVVGGEGEGILRHARSCATPAACGSRDPSKGEPMSA